MISIREQWYGATLTTDGHLYVDPWAFLPAYGYDLAVMIDPNDEELILDVLKDLAVPPFKRLWIFNPENN